MALYQRDRRIRFGYRGWHLDAAIPRASGRRTEAAAWAHPPLHKSGRDRDVRRPRAAAFRQPLGWQRDRPSRLPDDRALQPRGDDPGVDVRSRGRSRRKTYLDGARRQHDVCPLSRPASTRPSRARPQGIGELPRLSWGDPRRPLAHECGADPARASRRGVRGRYAAAVARRRRSSAARAYVVPRFRSRCRARPRARRVRGSSPRRHFLCFTRARRDGDACPLDRVVAIARHRAGAGAASAT